MGESDRSSDFSTALAAVLDRAADQRIRDILQKMGAAIDAGRLERLRSALDRIPADSKRKSALELGRIPEQFAAAIPQIVALDLDRVPPLRILGIGRNVGDALFGAKVLGHEVVAVCRKDFLNKWLFWLYELPHVDRSRSADLPEGRFDLIVAAGTQSLATKLAWTSFLAPLADRLADDGRIFVALTPEPDPEKNYNPQMVMAKLAQMGARISSKHHFVLLDQQTLWALDTAPPTVPDSGDGEADEEDALSTEPREDDRISERL